MTIKDFTRQAVIAAISEYDQVGQEAFLGRYGFERARLYVLVHDGKSYDSKAIVGAAHGYLPGEAPLAARQFSGGEATVGRLLRRLGFTVQVGEELTSDRLERLLAQLQVYRSNGVPALYQPITLLWAFGQAHRGEPRLVSWQETQQQLGALFQQYGRGRIPAPMRGSGRLLAGPGEPEGRQDLIRAHPLRRCPARRTAPQRRPL